MMMEETTLLQLRSKLRGAGYGVDVLRREVMNVIFEAKGLKGEELFERTVAIGEMFESLASYISDVKYVVDQEIDGLPKEE